MSQFLFFCVTIGNEKLLKKELSVFYPELKLSYSRKGFLTYKNTGVQYDLKSISELRPTFATRIGLSIGRARPEGILESVTNSLSEWNLNIEDCIVHSFSVGTDYELEAETKFKCPVNDYSANGKVVLDIVALSDSELWYGLHSVSPGITRFPNSLVDIDAPNELPSRSYFKLAEVIQLYGIKIQLSDIWLDFGASPGGASLYLLEKGAVVWGIDPAATSKLVQSHKNYNHIPTAVQDLSQEALPEDVSWVHADLNLNPTQAIKEVLRLCKKYNRTLRGIIFTVQLPNLDYIENIEEFEDQFYDWGFNDIKSVQGPSHKQEYVIIGKR